MPTQQNQATHQRRVTSANFPGGSAPHIRVQVRDGDKQWHLLASFSSSAQARRCARELDQKGIATRLVENRCSPVAS